MGCAGSGRCPRAGAARRAGVAPHILGAAALVLAMAGVGVYTATRGDDGAKNVTSDENGLPAIGAVVDSCEPTAGRPGPRIDLNVQSATGDPARPLRSFDGVRQLVRRAEKAGAEVISTTVSFRTMQPDAGGPINFEALDRTVGAARSAGLQVKVQLVGMPDWAMDDPQSEHPGAPVGGRAPEVVRLRRGVHEPRQGQGRLPRGLERAQRPQVVADRTRPGRVHPADVGDLPASCTPSRPRRSVVSGGLNGNDVGFLTHMYAARKTLGLKASPWDMVGTHPFSGAEAPDVVDPDKRYERKPYGLIDENFTGFAGLHHVMVENGDDLPVYITQFGYSTRGGEEPGGRSRTTSARPT